MKQVCITLGLIAATFTAILSVLPLSNLAIFPGIAALTLGFIAFYLSKKAGYVKKIVQFIFLLTTIALSITLYKALFTVTEVTNTDEMIIKEEESKQEAIEDLENLDLEDINI